MNREQQIKQQAYRRGYYDGNRVATIQAVKAARIGYFIYGTLVGTAVTGFIILMVAVMS